MSTCVVDCFLCDALFVLTTEAIPLGLGQNILTALIFRCTSFYACHTVLVGEKAAAELCSHSNRTGAALLLSLGSGVLCVEMVLARSAGDNLALFGYAKALAE